MTLNIRPLARTDRQEWARLWTAYLAFYDTVLPAPHYDLAFDRLLSDDHHTPFCLIAQDGGTPCGLAHYLFHAHGWQAHDICYLQDLFVDETARGGGVGRALIEHVAACAAQCGAGPVYWTTAQDNVTARALYDKVAKKTPFIQYKLT
ncbi:MAG: GNAT family N-acetyltransferase [Pseudomonadota bacterium]